MAVIFAAGLSAGVTGCTLKPKRADVVPTPSATGQIAISKIKAEYTDALKRAKGWQQNATLSRAYRQYQGTLNPDTPTLTFAFASLADPQQTYEVIYKGNDIQDRKVSKKPFELGFTPIDPSEWNVDPDTALETAEKQGGGQRFREQHLAGYTLLQQLAAVNGHPLQWYFRYDTGDGSHKRYEIFVNATSGGIDLKREISQP